MRVPIAYSGDNGRLATATRGHSVAVTTYSFVAAATERFADCRAVINNEYLNIYY